jgi:PAS domain S-box-containing protein
VVGALSVNTVQSLLRATTRVDRTDAVIQQLQSVLVATQDGETGQRGYLLTGDSAYLAPYRPAHQRADSGIAALRRAADPGSSWQPRIDSLSMYVNLKFRELDSSLAVYRVGNSAGALQIVRSNRGKALMDTVRSHIASLERDARQVRKDDGEARASAARRALWVIIVASLVAFALSVLVNRAVRSEMLHRLRSEEELERTASELAAQTHMLDTELEESQALAEELEQTTEQLQEALVEAEEGRGAAENADARTTAILSSLPDAISVFDHAWQWQYLNRHAAAIVSALGKKPEAMIGRTLWNELPELANTRFSAETRRALDTATVVEYEEHLPSLDRWFWNRIIPTSETVVTITQDITDRKRAAEDAQFSSDVNAVLAEAPLELEAMLNALARFAVPSLSDYCSIDVRDADGSVRRVAAVHRDPAKEEVLRTMWERYPYDPSSDVGSPEVLRTGVAQVTRGMRQEQITAFARTPEHASMLATLDPRSYIAVAIPATVGPPLGVIALVMSDSGRTMTDRSLELATMFATRAGGVVERAMLHQEVARARDAAAASAARFEFLANASQVLSSSLDYEVTLRHVAQLCVPELADWCAVAIVESDGTTKELAVAHKDPDKVEWARELNLRYPPDPNATSGVPQVIRSGRSELHADIPDELLRAGAVDEEHLRLIRQLGLTSAITVPMSARGTVHGAITLVSAESGRRYVSDDLSLAEELGRRAAMAVDNARLFREAEAARAEATSANRAKSDFLATISHEIRTPINAVLGYTQLIEMGLSGPLTAEQRVQIDRIASSTKHLLALVNEVLDLAKVESGTLAVQLERASVGTTVDDALALLRPQAAERGVTLSDRCEGERTSVFIGDAHRVRQVLTNLVANAVKFTSPGGTVTVTCLTVETPPPGVNTNPEAAYIAIRVMDNGEGIPADQLDRIFQPFTQVDSGYTREKSGTGLGLTISRQLAHLMGGEITVESVVDHGSTFTLWLPRYEEVRASLHPNLPSAADAGASTPELLVVPAAVDAATRRAEFERIADTLIRRVPDILATWRRRIRGASGIPEALTLTDQQIDDHEATYLTDVALTLRALGGASTGDADQGGLINDSRVIMRTVAEQHGRQRQRLGFLAISIEAELRSLAEATIVAIGSDRPSATPESIEAATVVRELTEQSIRVSRAAHRAAAAELT